MDIEVFQILIKKKKSSRSRRREHIEVRITCFIKNSELWASCPSGCNKVEYLKAARRTCMWKELMTCFGFSSTSPHRERKTPTAVGLGKQLAYLMCSHVRGKKRKLPGRNSTRQWVPSSFVVASCWIVGICMTASLAAWTVPVLLYIQTISAKTRRCIIVRLILD